MNPREVRRAAAKGQRFGPSEKTWPLGASSGLYNIMFGSLGCYKPSWGVRTRPSRRRTLGRARGTPLNGHCLPPPSLWRFLTFQALHEVAASREHRGGEYGHGRFVPKARERGGQGRIFSCCGRERVNKPVRSGPWREIRGQGSHVEACHPLYHSIK